MDLISKTETDRFGLRRYYPWSNYPRRYPWTCDVVTESEKCFVEPYLQHVIRYEKMILKRIENPFLWAKYRLRYEELSKNVVPAAEEIVVHATSRKCAELISHYNFDWRYVCRSRFGQGTSFATTAKYAKKHAYEHQVYIIAGILVGETSIGKWDLQIPPDGIETTVDRNNNVYVQYNNNDIYPYYMAEERA